MADSGDWAADDGTLTGSSTGTPTVALAEIDQPLDANSFLELTTTVQLGVDGIAGLVYDFYSADEYKFILLDVVSQRVVFGHVTDGGWVIDQVVAQNLEAGQAYTMLVTIKGASVSLVLNGTFVRSRAYHSALADGRVGVTVASGTAEYESFRLRTDGYDAPVVESGEPTDPPSSDPTEPPPSDPTDPPPTEPTDPPPPEPEPEPEPDPWVPPGRAKKT